MTVYDLKIDHDCTTRSRAVSTGVLYPSQATAEDALSKMNLEAWAVAYIEPMEVQE